MQPSIAEPEPSRLLLAGIVAGHVLALAAVLYCALDPAAEVTYILLALLSLAYHGERYGRRRSPRFVSRLTVTADGRCRLRYGDGRTSERGLHEWFVHPCLIVLVFERDSRHASRALVLTRDAVGSDVLRRFRVHLSWLEHILADSDLQDT